MTAVAFWTGFEYLAELLLYIALAGGALAIGLIIVRKLLLGLMTARASLTKLWVPRILLSGEPVPYGLAIAPSAIFLGTKLPQLGADFWL